MLPGRSCARSAVISASPNGPVVANWFGKVGTKVWGKQVKASQHAPPPMRNTRTSASGLAEASTAMPVGDPSPQTAPEIGTQVQVSGGNGGECFVLPHAA